MKKNYTIRFNFLCLAFLCLTFSHAQVNLYTQNFEGADFDTYLLTNSSGSSAGPFVVNGSDYITRAAPASLPLGNSVIGFTGNVIGLEDIDGAGFFGPHNIDTNPIDISGASGLSVKFRVAAPRGNDGNRYEAGDILQLQVSIDGGSFQTLISTGGVTSGDSTNGRFYHDVALNGITGTGDDVLIDQNSQELSANISGTGNSMIVRVLFNSPDSQEEMLFDDIIVDAASVLSSNEKTIENALSIYPNPSNGNITVKNAGIALDIIEIIDLNGRTIAQRNLDGITNDKELDLSTALSSGIYLARISSETAFTIKKIVIQ